MIPERWRKEGNCGLSVVSGESVAMVCENPVKVGGKPMAENVRYNKVMTVTTRLTQLLTSCGGNQFTDRMTVLQKITKLWEKRKEVMVFEFGEDGVLLGI